MNKSPSNDPLHGITLEKLLTDMVERHGWETLGAEIKIRCFQFDPSIKSSLTFLRRTPWARKKLEDWYVEQHRHDLAKW
jgi:uncharacterized protein (DUF2132 family)